MFSANGMSGGTAVMSTNPLRQIPSSRKGLPTRTRVSTQGRTVAGGPYHGPFDIVGGVNDARIGVPNYQRELGPAAPSRSINTPISDMTGLLVNGSSRTQKRSIGADFESDAKRRRIGQLADMGQAAPKVGVVTPRLNALAKDSEGLVYNQGMPPYSAIESDFYRNISPTSREAGSGGLIWGGFPNLPDTPFDRNYQNQGPGGAVYPGTASDNLFIDLGDRGQYSQIGANPLMNMTFSASATSKMETRSLSGAPNALVPYTHRISDGSQLYMPEEQRFMLWFSRMVVTEQPKNSVLNTFETKHAPLPFHEGYNLSAMNLALALMQPKQQNAFDAFSPEQFLALYQLMGPVRVDVGAKVSPLAVHPGNRQNRNLVVEVQGPGDSFNLWDNPKIGQTLYLIVKGVHVDKIRAFEGAPEGTYNITAQHPDRLEQIPADRCKVPLQVIPWCDPHGFRSPSLDDLMYIDSFGIVRHGVAISIGHLIQVFPEGAQPDVRETAPFSVHSTMHCGRVRFLVDINRAV